MEIPFFFYIIQYKILTKYKVLGKIYLLLNKN